jgi:hypothetical protein
VAALEEALGLWRGPAFGDLADVEVLRGPARRLDELRLAAHEDLAAGWVRSGQAARAAAAAEDLVATQPFREGAWAVLVEALAEGGRAQEALRAYQRAAGALAEAGLVPSARLRAAEAAALSAPALPTLADRLLPVRASALVGRDDDLAAVEESIGGARLVTVCGPGGVGKTRLALAVAERLGNGFRWGARLVALASVDDAAAVPTVTADALGLSVEEGGAAAALARAGNLDLLVVLDNCEHVIDAAASVAGLLLTGGSRARVLATSRERLGVDGERTWTLAPLSLGGDDPPARRLFLDRARAARPGAGSGPEDLDAADRIVHRLDGLPLAIEMAAGRAASCPSVNWPSGSTNSARSPRAGGTPRTVTAPSPRWWSGPRRCSRPRSGTSWPTCPSSLGAWTRPMSPPSPVERRHSKASAVWRNGRCWWPTPAGRGPDSACSSPSGTMPPGASSPRGGPASWRLATPGTWWPWPRRPTPSSARGGKPTPPPASTP